MLMNRMLSTGCKLHRPAIRKITASETHYRLLSRERTVSAINCRGNWLNLADMSVRSCQLQYTKMLQDEIRTSVKSCGGQKKC
jgi:hypothetical protein